MRSSILSLPEPTDDIAQGKNNLDLYGVTIHKNLLTPQQIDRLRGRLDEQASLERKLGVATFWGKGQSTSYDHCFPIGKPSKSPSYQAVTLLVNKGRPFIDLAKHSVCLAYVHHLLGETKYRVGMQVGLIVKKGGPPQPFHRDQAPTPFPIPIPVEITVSVALGEHEEDMAPTRVIPGSHRWQDMQLPPDNAETVPLIMEPGSAAFWEGRVWHERGVSTSKKVRHSILTSYVAHFFSSYDCFPASIHDDVYESMSNDELELYGFEFNGVNGRIGPRTRNDTRCNILAPVPYIPELRRKRSRD